MHCSTSTRNKYFVRKSRFTVCKVENVYGHYVTVCYASMYCIVELVCVVTLSCLNV